MGVLNAIIKSERIMKERGWDYVFYFFDIHETILYPDWNNKEELRFYENAKETLQLISKRDDIIMCTYTCSYPEQINRYVEFFKTHDIEFKYLNKNPEVSNTTYGYYEDKPYFNVLFEDKAGFDADEEWKEVYKYFK